MAQYDAYQYLSEKTYNNELPGEGETIAPFVVSREQVESDHMDRNNLKTWPLRGGRKVLVAFMIVKVEEFDATMKLYNYMADGDHEHHLEDADSLDKMKEDAEDPDKSGKMPEETTVESAEDVAMIWIEINEMIEEISSMDPKSGSILSLIVEDVRENGKLNKGNILAKLGLRKSQGYEDIKKAQKLARKYRDMYW